MTLTVTDDQGATATALTTATIDGGISNITVETEPNDSSGTANGPLGIGISAAGRLSSSTDKEWYYFDVPSSQNLTISMDMTSPSGVNWLLYHESNLSSYVAYPTNGLNGTFNATQSGRYYLEIHTWEAGDRPYTLTVK